MKFVVFTVLCVSLAAATPEDFPTSRLMGQFSGLDEPSKRLVDLRLRFFTRRSGGLPVDERRIQSVQLDRGRFSVALDLSGLTRHLNTRRVYVEIGLRPAGRRYARYAPAGPRRVLRMDRRAPYQVWHLERTLPVASAEGSTSPPLPHLIEDSPSQIRDLSSHL